MKCVEPTSFGIDRDEFTPIISVDGVDVETIELQPLIRLAWRSKLVAPSYLEGNAAGAEPSRLEVLDAMGPGRLGVAIVQCVFDERAERAAL